MVKLESGEELTLVKWGEVKNGDIVFCRQNEEDKFEAYVIRSTANHVLQTISFSTPIKWEGDIYVITR